MKFLLIYFLAMSVQIDIIAQDMPKKKAEINTPTTKATTNKSDTSSLDNANFTPTVGGKTLYSIDKLAAYFTPNQIKVRDTVVYELDSMEQWFQNEAAIFLKKQNHLLVPKELDTTSYNLQTFLRLLRQTLSANKNEIKTFSNALKNCVNQIPISILKVWAELRLGDFYIYTDSLNQNFYKIRNQTADLVKNQIEMIKDNYAQSRGFEYLGDFYAFYYASDSAMSYYLKAQLALYRYNKYMTKQYTVPLREAELSMKMGKLYSSINYFNDFTNISHFNSAIEAYKNQNYFEGYYVAMARRNEELYLDYWNIGILDSTKVENFVNYLLLRLNNGPFREEQILLLKLASVILKDHGKLEAASKASKVGLIFLFNEKNYPNKTNLTSYFLQSLTDFNKPIKQSFKFAYDTLSNDIFQFQFDKMDECFRFLNKNELDSAKSLINSFNIRTIDSIFAPPVADEIYRVWVNLKVLQFREEKKNDLDSLIYYQDRQTYIRDVIRKRQFNFRNAELMSAINGEVRVRNLLIKANALLDEATMKAKLAFKNESIAKYEVEKQRNIADSTAKDAISKKELADKLTDEADSLKNEQTLINKKLDSTNKKLAIAICEKNRNLNLALSISVGALILGGLIFWIKRKSDKNIGDANRLKLEAQAAIASLNPHFIHGIVKRFPVHVESLAKGELKNFSDNINDLVASAYSLLDDFNGKVSIAKELTLIHKLVKYYNETDHAKNKVDFIVPESADARLIIDHNYVPPLLIFNTVENALTKAFSEKYSGKKIIRIEFKYIDDRATIIIEDNGRGFLESDIEKRGDKSGGIEKNKIIMNYYNSISQKGNRLKYTLDSKLDRGTKITYQYI